MKGDLEIWFNALLIASIPKPLRVGLLYLRSWWCSFSYEKDSLGGASIYDDNYYYFHYQKRNQTEKEFVFVARGVALSLDGQSPFAWPCCSIPERCDFQL